MSKTDAEGRARLPADDDDDIEIVEIVGLEDSQPIEIEEEAGEAAGSDDLILSFDDRDSDTAVEEERTRRVRIQADFENYKKRVDRERETDQLHAAARVVQNLLPVLDNFERAIASATGEDHGSSLHQGVQLIFRQLLDELRREGLVAIDTVGEPFDPELHEAVATEEHGELPHQTIIEELQRGYSLNGRLLRPALVKVSTRPGMQDDGSSHYEGF
jgi:molecular chaperone GrpE